MALKYKVGITLLVIGSMLGLGGYAVKLVYISIAGLLIFILSISVLIFSDTDDKSILSIVADGIFFSL